MQYAGSTPRVVAFLALLAASTFALSGASSTTMTWLAASAIPLSLSSKVPQIVSNARLGSTGQLSAFLVFNSLAGCLARVFTTATETGDRILWLGFVGAAALNAVLAVQMALYWNQSPSATSTATTGPKQRLTSGGRTAELEKVQVAQQSSPSSNRRYVRKLD